jgi:hypothetical protein
MISPVSSTQVSLCNHPLFRTLIETSTHIIISPVQARPRMTVTDPLSEFVLGYPKLAAQMELQPEISMFRRFGFLNAQNLLYFQAELITLESRLRDHQRADSLDTKGSKKSQYGLNWYWLEHSRDDGDTQQLDLVLKIRGTMKEYSEFFVDWHDFG